MATVNNLCNQCIVLHAGRLCFHGGTEEGIHSYLASHSATSDRSKAPGDYRPHWAAPWITNARLRNADGVEQSSFALGGSLIFEIDFQSPGSETLRSPVMGLVIHHLTFGTVGAVNTRMTGFAPIEGQYRSGTLTCRIDNFPFLQGQYTADLWLGDGPANLDVLNGFIEFHIEDGDVYGTGKVPFAHLGVGILYANWEFEPETSAITAS
jgi:lipopolysaccharide transport system ATP-binding protein